MNTRAYFPAIAFAGLSLLQASCSSPSTVVGDEALSSSGGSTAAPRLPERLPGDPACAANDDLRWQIQEDRFAPNDFNELKGHWYGATKNGMTATLDLRKDGTGTLYFGTAEDALEPASDPTLGYYCDVLDTYGYCDYSTPPYPTTPWLKGFAYTVRAARFANGHLDFILDEREPWSSWCAQQEPHAWGECTFMPYASTTTYQTSQITDTGRTFPCTLGAEEVDCEWLAVMQNHTCFCTSAQCFSGLGSYQFGYWGASLVVSSDGDSMSGVLSETELVLER